MTKQQENRAFVKMLKEFPKAFGRVSFRERLMLRTAFSYVVEEVIGDIKANCDLAIEGRDITIKELTVENVELKERYNKVDIIGYDALKKLTKAKEIIKTLADDLSVYSGNYQKELLEAKQFLKEIEK